MVSEKVGAGNEPTSRRQLELVWVSKGYYKAVSVSKRFWLRPVRASHEECACGKEELRELQIFLVLAVLVVLS